MIKRLGKETQKIGGGLIPALLPSQEPYFNKWFVFLTCVPGAAYLL